MAQTEIPEDIRETARRMCEYGDQDRMFMSIARALLAEREAATAKERERCALIAESNGGNQPRWPTPLGDSEALDWGWLKSAQRIASSIRGDHHG